MGKMAETAWQATWGDKKFVEDWASKGNWQAPIRDVQTAMVLRCGDFGAGAASFHGESAPP